MDSQMAQRRRSDDKSERRKDHRGSEGCMLDTRKEAKQKESGRSSIRGRK